MIDEKDYYFHEYNESYITRPLKKGSTIVESCEFDGAVPGQVLYKISIETTLLDDKYYKQLRTLYNNDIIIEKLKNHFESQYSFLMTECHIWYQKNEYGNNLHNLNLCIGHYESKVLMDGCCSIIYFLVPSCKKLNVNNNKNFYKRLKQLTSIATIEKITDLDQLLHLPGQENVIPRHKIKRTVPAELAQNAMLETIYDHFYDFLIAEKNKLIKQTNINSPKNWNLKIKPAEQINLFNKLTEEKMIGDIKLNIFLERINGICDNKSKKILWLKSKGMAIQLFEKITLKFSMGELNKLVQKNNCKPFDDNDRNKNGEYHEINELLNQIRNTVNSDV